MEKNSETMQVRYKDKYITLKITDKEYEELLKLGNIWNPYCSWWPQDEIVEQRIRKFRWDENKQLLVTRGKSKKSTKDELIKRVFDNWNKDTILFE